MKNIKYILFFVSIIFSTYGHTKDMEWNIDRPGSDIANFNLSSADPKVCKKRCDKNSKCKAWTYVRPYTTQGQYPRCWLKSAIPRGKKNSCCVSGLKKVIPPKIEWNIDRPGSDISNFNLPKANPKLCQNRCAKNSKCKAWTYVRPHTIQGSFPRCWLKSRVPAARKSSCCASGIKK